MQRDEIAMKLGEIAGTLQQVVAGQSVLMTKQDNYAVQQAALLSEVAAVKSTVGSHDARLGTVEATVSKLQLDSARHTTIIGALAATGVTLIAEGIRQFLRLKSGSG